MTQPLPVIDPRERLLMAAEELFAHKGFDGTTVREICDRAGMNGAAVNYHFRDKETLYVEAVRNAHRCTEVGPGGVTIDPAAAPVDRLRGVIRQLVEQMTAPVRPTALQLLMRELGQPSDATRAVVEDFIRPMAHVLTEVLRDLMPSATEPERWMVGFSVVGQCLFYKQNRTIMGMLYAGVDDLTVAVVTAHITRFTLAALGQAEPYPTTSTPEAAS